MDMTPEQETCNRIFTQTVFNPRISSLSPASPTDVVGHQWLRATLHFKRVYKKSMTVTWATENEYGYAEYPLIRLPYYAKALQMSMLWNGVKVTSGNTWSARLLSRSTVHVNFKPDCSPIRFSLGCLYKVQEFMVATDRRELPYILLDWMEEFEGAGIAAKWIRENWAFVQRDYRIFNSMVSIGMFHKAEPPKENFHHELGSRIVKLGLRKQS